MTLTVEPRFIRSVRFYLDMVQDSPPEVRPVFRINTVVQTAPPRIEYFVQLFIVQFGVVRFQFTQFGADGITLLSVLIFT